MVHAGLLNKPGAIGRLMGRATAGPNGFISEAEKAAYQAPFPDETYIAGAIQYPNLSRLHLKIQQDAPNRMVVKLTWNYGQSLKIGTSPYCLHLGTMILY